MREVGALLEAKAVHGGRSAYSHLLCLAQTNSLPRRRVGEVLELVGLSEVARKRVKGFSLGMSQRLGIAGTLLGDPRVLMFDEPVNGLDPEGILWIRNLMKALAAEGRTVFVSSHLMSEMENTADHLIVIGRGRLIADCTMAEFIARSSGAAVRVRTPSARAAGAGGDRAGRDRGDRRATAALEVRGMTAEQIGDLAFGEGIAAARAVPGAGLARGGVHGADGGQRGVPGRRARPAASAASRGHDDRKRGLDDDSDGTGGRTAVRAPARRRAGRARAA